MCMRERAEQWVSHSVYYKERMGRLSQWSAVILDRGCFRGMSGVCVSSERRRAGGAATGLERTAALSSSSLLHSVPPGRSFDPPAFSKVVLGLDEGLGLAAVVHLDVDLGVRVALVSKALEVAAVAQQVDGQAESQHADCQEAHVHLEGSARRLLVKVNCTKLTGFFWR